MEFFEIKKMKILKNQLRSDFFNKGERFVFEVRNRTDEVESMVCADNICLSEGLEKGNTGPAVKLLQRALIDLGYLEPTYSSVRTGKSVDSNDGDFGSGTLKALMSFKKYMGFPTNNESLTQADIVAMRNLLKDRVERETKDEQKSLQKKIIELKPRAKKIRVERKMKNQSIDYKERLSQLKANAEEIREDAFKLAESLRTSFAYASINDRLFSQDLNSADLENGVIDLRDSKDNQNTIYAMNNIADILVEGCHEKNLQLSPNKKEVFKRLKTRGFAAVMNPREKQWVVYKNPKGKPLENTRYYDKDLDNFLYKKEDTADPTFKQALAEVNKMNNEPNSNYETIQKIINFISLKNRFEKKAMMHKKYLRKSVGIEN